MNTGNASPLVISWWLWY